MPARQPLQSVIAAFGEEPGLLIPGLC